MSLDSRWIDAIHTRLMVRYGAKWLNMWAGIDPEMVKEVLDVMKQLAASGMTMLVVTHEMGFAREVGDRILFLDKGCIAADAPPEQFFGAQANERIRAFLGQILH